MRRLLKVVTLLVLLLLLSVTAVVWVLMRGSLAQLDGETAMAGLSATVSVQRDALGVVTIDAANENDAMRALGYVHAQERYFEMDLMRRVAAGELSALVGADALGLDRRQRMFRMRAHARAQLPEFLQASPYADGVSTLIANDVDVHGAGSDADQGTMDAVREDSPLATGKTAVVTAYVEGVNSGLAALSQRPWPYLLLRQQPRPWTAVDSMLTGEAMYFDLQAPGDTRDLALWQLKQHLPAALFALIAHDGSTWDAPLQGEPRGDAVLPDAGAVNLRTLPMPKTPRTLPAPDAPPVGSNNFAVDGSLTADGRAIVADDMHLGLRAPNIWFRVRLRYPDARAPDGRVDVSGFSLPGLPAVIVGSNGHVAWALTNGYADTSDWQRSLPAGARDAMGRAISPVVSTFDETIAVANGNPSTLQVQETNWGPILRTDAQGNRYSLRWVAQQPGALNLGLLDFAYAADVDAVDRAADTVGIPLQNLIVGDRSGAIAWRPLGARRAYPEGCDDSPDDEDRPGLPDDADREGNTPLDPAPPGVLTPRHRRGFCSVWGIDTALQLPLQPIQQPRLWTGNNRTLDGDGLATLGDAGYELGARARQIRDGLTAKQQFAERDLLAIQLDDRALFLQRWWTLLKQQSKRGGAATPALAELAQAADAWQPRASPDAVSYRIVRAWRLAVLARLADGLTAPAQVALGKDFLMPKLTQFEGTAWPLVTQQPMHLLPRRYASWNALFDDAARDVRDGLATRGPLDERRWGELNTAAICHPLAKGIPLIGKRLLCMPADALAGDNHMPRVNGPSFGASERMVVSPGHEQDGIVHMPGGQSGHPLSPFWGAGHEDWVKGTPTPFLPGKAAYTLTLTPAPAAASAR